MTGKFLCKLSELDDPGSKGFDGESEYSPGIFLVRRNDQVFAYRNQCPHTGASLEWMPDRSLDISGEWIQCTLHGALFEIETGRCVRGPCLGESLKSVKIKFDNKDTGLLDHIDRVGVTLFERE